MWRDYDPAVTERDLGYATRLNLNAIRTWGSYEFWREDPAAFETAFEDFLQTSDDYGIKPLVGLFEGIGDEPTRENLTDDDLMTATGVASPSKEILQSKDRWEETREFVRWFMNRYADDERLLAIELINEPGWNKRRIEFSKSMYETMREMRGSVPLTVGSTSMSKNSTYAKWGLDLFQFHYNFPPSQPTFRNAVQRVQSLDDVLSQPVMLTEWQRVRSVPGFHNTQPRNQRTPNYASMAPILTELGMSNFFWSLMLQPAYFWSQRQMGVLNGVFHEDGAVWSLDDARSLKAMSGDDEFDGEERNEWPRWAKPIKTEVYGE
ncbi:glycoside hydrolase [Haloferax sp. MBLA0076]|uniref:Glycoside hydrolase n=2 Tax=Haloferacaceae TaxID=1644056 RepID=A0A6A8GJZ2_9EURY|nr:glycoside hydrolase [Haloferax sp. CBA1148]MRX23503.1 glycoside hydrolase [Haloferax litoreum]